MVFVTVGNAQQSFRRFLEAVDDLAGRDLFHGEQILVQRGNNADFVPRHCEWRSFMPPDEFRRHLVEASLILSHGGATLLEVIRLGRTPVAMPRQKARGEHINDHQVAFVRELAAEGWVVPAYEAVELSAAVMEARSRQPRQAPQSRMLNLVEEAIEELLRIRKR